MGKIIAAIMAAIRSAASSVSTTVGHGFWKAGEMIRCNATGKWIRKPAEWVAAPLKAIGSALGGGGSIGGGDELSAAGAEAERAAANANQALDRLERSDAERMDPAHEKAEAEWRRAIRATQRYAEYLTGARSAEPSLSTLSAEMRDRLRPTLRAMTQEQARDILSDTTGSIAMMFARGGTLRRESAAMRAATAPAPAPTKRPRPRLAVDNSVAAQAVFGM